MVPTYPTQHDNVQQANDFLGSLSALTSVVNERLVTEFRRALGRDCTLSRYMILKVIACTEVPRVADLSLCLGTSTAAVSKRVERLVRAELLERVAVASDRRAHSLRLTRKGVASLARYESVHRRVLHDMFVGYSPEALRHCGMILDRLSMGIFRESDSEPEVCLRCGVHFRETCRLREMPFCSCSGLDKRLVGALYSGSERND